tara:strand:+ start:1769 stop:2491 length:723 start_codon:yes stop_codon:yes gene_type:complete
MHASMQRVHKISGLTKKVDIAKDLGVNASTITNWSSRGVSKEGALKVAALYGADANYIMTGVEKSYINQTMAIDSIVDSLDSFRAKLLRGLEMPVFKMISKESYQKLFNDPPACADDNSTESSSDKLNVEIYEWIKKPNRFSVNSFALLVAGDSNKPDISEGDYACIEPNTNMNSLDNGDFVVVQHHKDKDAVIKKVVFGARITDIYLTHINKDIPSDGLDSMKDYDLIGVIKNNITSYW